MNATEKNRRILVIDDNLAIHEDFRKTLGGKVDATVSAEQDALAALEADLFGDDPAAPGPMIGPYLLDTAAQGQEGFEMVRRAVELDQRYALAFVDMRMPPGWDGVTTIERIWQVDPDIQIVICTAYSDYSWEDIIRRCGAHDRLLILKKPFDTAEVCQLACALTEKWHLARRAHLKLAQLESMVVEHTRELQCANRQLQIEVAERQRSEDRYRLAAVGANDGLWDWDRISGYIYVAPRFRAILGWEGEEGGNDPADWLMVVHPEDREPFGEAVRAFWKDGRDQFHREVRMVHADGGVRWVLCRGTAQRDAADRKIRAAGSISDITDRKLAEEQLRFDAHHDALTGLANRQHLVQRLDALLAAQEVAGGPGFALLFMDLDRFKVINDSLGHVVGDKLLQCIAERLRSAVRLRERGGRLHQDVLARLGGDEFVLLTEGVEKPEAALRIAERIHGALEDPFSLDGHEVTARVSIGITLCGREYTRGEDVMRDADTAMYHAKAEGRGGTRVFDAGMHAGAMVRWRVETDLRHAIDRGELVLHYQPVLDGRGNITALEALVRWNHPTNGIIPPGDFIPVAEESGLIVPLGRWVLMEACQRLVAMEAELRALGVERAEPLVVAVNVSARQFNEPGFGLTITDALSVSGLPPAQLVLEITETTAMGKAEASVRQLAALRELGVRFYLDDFGTGYSSLSYLHRMPIAALKIDRSFVALMETDDTSRSIVESIIALAHALKMVVLAEGVETPEVFQALRRMGADGFQGFLFHRPVPAERIVEILRAGARAPTPALAGPDLPVSLNA